MTIEIKEWDTLRKEVGKSYYFIHDGRFHAILETKVGAYRGNHIHPVRQRTMLLSGEGWYATQKEGERFTEYLTIGEPLIIEAGFPHILIPETDIITFEWWEGDYTSKPCGDLFKDLTLNKIGDEDPQD
jgi:hypothetical protein